MNPLREQQDRFPSLTVSEVDEGAILKIAITSPRSALNTVDEQLHHELEELFAVLRATPPGALRAIILTGNGVAFSAGGDFAWFQQLQGTERLLELQRSAKAMIWNLLDVEVPIVVALEGPAVGLGASVALLCDAVVACPSTRISDPHVRVGLVAGDGGAVIWPLTAGPAVAKRHLLTGDPLTGGEAFRLGLVTDLVEEDKVQNKALAIARTIARQPPIAVRYTKAAINKGVRHQMELVFDYATALEITTFQTADHVEAVSALIESRHPTFEGR